MHCWPYRRSHLAFLLVFLIGLSKVYGQPSAAKETPNYTSAFVICASIKDERGIFSALSRFQFIFPKLLKICEQRSIRDSSEGVSLNLSVAKSCSVQEALIIVNLKLVEQSSFFREAQESSVFSLSFS